MFAKLVLSDEERAVDPQLGYPRGYAKLCRHAHVQMQGLITPYTEGPPQRFLPYSLQQEDLEKLKEFDKLFPIIADEERDPSSAGRHADFLWQQLDHLGNAGFDPAKFRVDRYGNVLYRDADQASPLAWEVDHWFPETRGGKTVVSNLRIVQWQVNQRRNKRLEFLVPWWDLQLGISVNQFMSVFTSKNEDFRQRAFSLLFLAGENEQLDEKLVAGCHSWPQHFRERKRESGLAAAALVRVQNSMDDPFRILNGTRAMLQSGALGARRRWSTEGDEALRRIPLQYGHGSCKEIAECEPIRASRSAAKMKDMYRLMRGDWQLDKENGEDIVDMHTATAAALQKEQKLTQLCEAEKKQKVEEIVKMEEELKTLKGQNEKERKDLSELEETLVKQRKRVEKQRRWSESQSQYRQCLEKMIRDIMHQNVVYKEQARLNQAACNALLARLESQKVACDTAELDLIKRFKHRETLEALARPPKQIEYIRKRLRKEGQVDVTNCSKQPAIENHGPLEWVHANLPASNNHDTKTDKDYTTAPVKVIVRSGEDHNDQGSAVMECFKGIRMRNEKESLYQDKGEAKAPVEEPAQVKHGESPNSSTSSGLKRKASEEGGELDIVNLDSEYSGHSPKILKAASVGDNAIHSKPGAETDQQVDGQTCAFEGIDKVEGIDKEGCFPKGQEDEQLEQLLQEVLAMQGKVNAAMADANEEEDEAQRIRRVGKSNLDKWLQMLLFNTETVIDDPAVPDEDGCEREGSTAAAIDINLQDKQNKIEAAAESSKYTQDQTEPIKQLEDEEKPKRVFGGLLRKLSFKQLPFVPPFVEEQKKQVGEKEFHVADPPENIEETSKFSNTKRREEDKRQHRSAFSHVSPRSFSPWRRSAPHASKEVEQTKEQTKKAQHASKEIEKRREQTNKVGPGIERQLNEDECKHKVVDKQGELHLDEEARKLHRGSLKEVPKEKLHGESFASDKDFVKRMREVRKEAKMMGNGDPEELLQPKGKTAGGGQSAANVMMKRSGSVSVRGGTPTARERGSSRKNDGEERDTPLLRASVDGPLMTMMRRKNSFSPKVGTTRSGSKQGKS